MNNLFVVPLLGILVSFYFFPVSFTFLPGNLNSKMIIGILGIILFIKNALEIKKINFSKELIGAIGIASTFSLLCLVSCELNNTNDYSYATYIISFSTWLIGAYAICDLLRMYHGRATLKLITAYLTAASTFQCIISQIINYNLTVKYFIDSIFLQGTSFLEEVDRLYGIGASLDPAGCRFSIVLILITYTIFKDNYSKWHLYLYWTCFGIIAILGNIISRTTSVGLTLSLLLLLYKTIFFSNDRTSNKQNIILPFIIILLTVTGISYLLYNYNDAFHDNMRFAFEGFFNWIERGVWTTGSTEKLNRTMWIWPKSDFVWIWGTGLFDNFIYSTDIGYCRFILYCGLVGFSVFCLFFLYNAWAVYHQKKIDLLLTYFFVALTFIIWIKVSTDIFVVYALLYCIDSISEDNGLFSLTNSSTKHTLSYL